MTRTIEIDNSIDIIDSRDIVERINYLEIDTNVDEAEELTTLNAVVEEMEGYAGDKASDGISLIRDSYFKEYAQEFADDTGVIHRNATWPTDCIDWDQAARELQMHYTNLEFEHVTYWYR